MISYLLSNFFDGDGNLDLLINGNDFGTEVSTGRYDALNGLQLKGNNGKGGTPLPIAGSGIYLPGNGKALVKLRGAANSYLLAVSEHAGPLRVFHLNANVSTLKINDTDQGAVITYKMAARPNRNFIMEAHFFLNLPGYAHQ